MFHYLRFVSLPFVDTIIATERRHKADKLGLHITVTIGREKEKAPCGGLLVRCS